MLAHIGLLCFVKKNEIVYFYSFGVEHVSEEIKGAPVGTAGAIFTLFFSLTTGIIKELLSITKNKKTKHR